MVRSANYFVNSIVCALTLVRGSRVPAYGIQPTHGPIHVLDMHGTWTKHFVCYSQKSGSQFKCKNPRWPMSNRLLGRNQVGH